MGSELRAVLNQLYSHARQYPTFHEFVLHVLASLPGGEYATHLGYEPYCLIGFKEAKLLASLLLAIDDNPDQILTATLYLTDPKSREVE